MKSRRPRILPRIVYFVLLSFSAPLWLLLRSWYGPRLYFILLIASLTHPFALLWFSMLLDTLDFEDTAKQLEHWLDWSTSIIILGFGIQLVIIVLQITAITISRMWRSHPAFAGSFLLWPASRRTFPFDFIGLVALAYILPLGVPLPPMTILDIAVALPPHQIDDAAIFIATIYGLLVIDITFNNGRLRFFDSGEEPKSHPRIKPKPANKFQTRISKTAKPSAETLGEIFSRRDKALKDINQSVDR